MTRKIEMLKGGSSALENGKEDSGITPEKDKSTAAAPADDFTFTGSSDAGSSHPAAEPNPVFLDSLESARAEDVAPGYIRRRPRRTAGDYIRTVIFLLCMAVFSVCVYMLIKDAVDSRRTDILYGGLTDGIFQVGSDTESSPDTSDRPCYSLSDILSARLAGESIGINISGVNIQFERMKSLIQSLSDNNPDTYGWIRVEDTHINYPILHGEDNNYYLEHAYNAEFLKSGSIYADYRCADTLEENRNTVMYGHNMLTGTMFHDVEMFLDEDFFDSTYITIYTTEGIYTYEPFAIFNTRASYQYFRVIFDSDEDYVSFLYEMQSQSRFNKNMEFNKDDKIITLSTCTNLTMSGRYALHAKLISVQLNGQDAESVG